MIAEIELERKQNAELGSYSPRPGSVVIGDGEGQGQGSSSGSQNSPPANPPGGELRPVTESEVLESQYSPRRS